MIIQLVDNVLKTVQIILSLLQFTLSFFATSLVFQNPCSFFENSSAFFRLGIKNLLNLPLGNDGEGISSQTCIQEKIMNITQTDFLAVNLVFAISTTIDMAFHPNFLTCILDKSVMIIQSHNYRSIIERFATFCSSKDDIWHLATTETFNT